MLPLVTICQWKAFKTHTHKCKKHSSILAGHGDAGLNSTTWEAEEKDYQEFEASLLHGES